MYILDPTKECQRLTHSLINFCLLLFIFIFAENLFFVCSSFVILAFYFANLFPDTVEYAIKDEKFGQEEVIDKYDSKIGHIYFKKSHVLGSYYSFIALAISQTKILR